MHLLALGGGSLASLRVVCPERLQRRGAKGDYRDGNHSNTHRAADQLYQPHSSRRLHRDHASSADEAVRRLASLAIRSAANLQLNVAKEDAERSLDLIVYISRKEGRRRIEEVARVGRSV